MNTTLKVRNHNGGSMAVFESRSNKFSAYGATKSDSIKNLADQNFGPDTSTYKALVWYAQKVAKGHNTRMKDFGVVLGDMSAIGNSWYREVLLKEVVTL